MCSKRMFPKGIWLLMSFIVGHWAEKKNKYSQAQTLGWEVTIK